MRKPDRSDCLSLLATVLMVSLLTELASAQVIYDGSLGSAERNQSARTQPGSTYYSQYTYAVESAHGEVRGQNLFHGFSQFVVGSEETVGLVGEGRFDNVFLRVDSGIVVDGPFTSEHAGADVYLLSRNGITVGSGGLFDVTGGLTLGTADSVLFGTGSFPTDDIADLVDGCCEGDPVALVFEGGYLEGLASIEIDGPPLAFDGTPEGLVENTVESFRATAESVSIARRSLLLGGDKVIHLVAVGEAELTVPLNSSEVTPGVDLLGPEALLELNHLFIGNQNGPDHQERVLLEGGILRLVENSQVHAKQSSDRTAIELRAGQAIELIGSEIRETTLSAAGPDPLDAAVRLDAPRISMTATEVEADTIKRSSIDATAGFIWLSGAFIELNASDIKALGLLRDAGTPTPSLISHDVGIYLDATEKLALSGGSVVESTPFPIQGYRVPDIQISAGSLEIVDGSQVNAWTMNGRSGGNISVDVRETFLLSGVRPSIDEPEKDAISTLGARTHPNEKDKEVGAGTTNGTITVRAGRLEVSNGGLISGRSFTLADSGDIDISVDGLLRLSGEMLDVPSEIASRAGFKPESGDGGSGGTIVIRAGRIEMGEATAISAGSATAAPAGEVSLTATNDILIHGARIYTRAPQGEMGGNLQLNAGERIELVDAIVETHVARGDGNAGRIELGLERAPRHLVLNQSDLRTTADEGTGGNIDVVAENFLMSKNSSIDTKSRRGVDGLLSINAPEVEAAGQVEPLPASYLDVSALLKSHCAARPGAGSSSFTVEGRPGLPAPLDGFRPGAASAPGPHDASGAQRGGSVREQLERFDLGCGRSWRLASRPG